MDWELTGKYLGIFLVSGIKYLIGVSAAMASVHSPFEGFLLCTLGGLFGAVVVTYSGDQLIHYLRQRARKKNKPRFTKSNRRLVRIKKYGGVPIIALLSPIFISIPVGCLFALTFENRRNRIILWMLVSLILWGLLLFGFKWVLQFISRIDL